MLRFIPSNAIRSIARRAVVAGIVGAAIAGSATPSVSAQTTATTRKSAATNIVATAVAAGSFKTLAAALTQAGLVETLSGPGPFTVFAPTDAAFAKIPKAQLDALVADKAALTKVLTYHVVAGKVPAAQVVKLKTAKTLNGANVSIAVVGGGVVLNGNVKVVTTDVNASNGVIHVIDSVLIPPGLTLPAPVVTTGPSTVAPAVPAAGLKDIVDTAVAAGSFKTLAAALTQAGLIETLKGPGPFTVFAPTDAAFAKLPKADLDALLANKKALTDVLTYHVVAGRVPASQVVSLTSAKTVNGATVKISVRDGKVLLNDIVNVVTTDIAATNGIIHVIDTVLLPPAASTAPGPNPRLGSVRSVIDVAGTDARFSVLAQAVTVAGLVDTLRGPGPFTVFAPTNLAFDLVDPSTLTSLLAPAGRGELIRVLTYHVVPGRFSAADAIAAARAGRTLRTVQGGDLRLSLVGNKLFINHAEVLITDIDGGNGVIHAIDTVLTPPKA